MRAALSARKLKQRPTRFVVAICDHRFRTFCLSVFALPPYIAFLLSFFFSFSFSFYYNYVCLSLLVPGDDAAVAVVGLVVAASVCHESVARREQSIAL